MAISKYFTRRTIVGGIGVLAIAFVGWSLVYERVTRQFIASDRVCAFCHLPWEFSPGRQSATKPHLATLQGGQAKCVDCHLPKGFWNTTFAYTHFVSLTDLFGYVRQIDKERVGAWTAYRAKTAYRVRDRLHATDSGPCRTCHVESEIKPKRERGVNAHKLAIDEKKTCIECHYNLVHRSVDPRQAAKPSSE